MKLLEEIEGLVSSKVRGVKTMIAIAKLETKLAGLSVFPLLLNVVLLLMIAIAIWFVSMGLLAYGLVAITSNILLAITLVLFLNLILFFVLLSYLKFNLKRMSFEKTRELMAKREKPSHESETRNLEQNSSNGTDLTRTES